MPQSSKMWPCYPINETPLPSLFYSWLMEPVCMRSPFHCLLVKPPKSFIKCFYDTVYFNELAQRRASPVNQCFCLKTPVSFSESCDTCAETVRPIETYKITPFLCVLISLTRRQTHKQPLKGDCIGSHIWASEAEIGKSLSFALLL